MGIKRNKKIALMTIFQVPNYGSVLQTYATQIFLLKLGYDCDVINYHYPNDWHYQTYVKRINPIRSLVRTIFLFLRLRPADKFLHSINQFRKNKLHLTRKFKDLRTLESYDWHKYDAVVAGSDQIWNPRFLHGDKAFMLSFVPDDIKKISIASSFACHTILEEFRSKYFKYLSRFSNISVRDNNGVGIITNELKLSTKPFVALDPTLLLSGKEWLSNLDLKDKATDKYILVYILSYAFNPYPYIYDVVAEMQHRYHCKAIFLSTRYNGEQNLNVESRINASPIEFINLIHAAECVITSSFHGTAFAASFQRPLISIVPDNGDDRQSSLLTNLGIPHCAVKIGTPVTTLNPCYDYNHVERKLNEIRTENQIWVSDALDN